jgi:hypothetical protein
MFNDPRHGDFTFRSLRTARKIGFQPFDYTRAGVEGDEAWNAKAQMKPEELEDFRRIVREGEKAYVASGEADYRPEVARKPGKDRIYPRYYE